MFVSITCPMNGCHMGGSMRYESDRQELQARKDGIEQLKEAHALGRHEHYNQVIDGEPDPSKRKF